jgi:hypothetical protein
MSDIRRNGLNAPGGDEHGPCRWYQASLVELLWLVGAVAVVARWPGLVAPVSLLFLYVFARRRNILRRPTRSAVGQVALAVYLPPILTFLGMHLSACFGSADWRQYWSFVGRDYFMDLFVGHVSLIPAFVPAFILMIPFGSRAWASNPGNSTEFKALVEAVVLSLCPVVMIGVLGMVAKRGTAWRIGCVTVATLISGLSTYALFVISVAGP